MTVHGHNYGLHGQRPSDATTAGQTDSRKESKASEDVVQPPVKVSEEEVPETQPPTVTPTPIKQVLTPRVMIMTILVSLGGMVFGYGGIGTIGGFLLMSDYRQRFGTEKKDVSAACRAL